MKFTASDGSVWFLVCLFVPEMYSVTASSSTTANDWFTTLCCAAWVLALLLDVGNSSSTFAAPCLQQVTKILVDTAGSRFETLESACGQQMPAE